MQSTPGMNNVAKILVTLATFTLASLAACSSDDTLDTFPAELATGASFDDAQPCDADQACPAGLSCMVVELVDGATDPLCLDSDTICTSLECGDRECALLESYPAIAACLESGDSPDGDDPVSS